MIATLRIGEASRLEDITDRSDEVPEAPQGADGLAVLRLLRIHFKGRVSSANLRDMHGALSRVLRAKYRAHRLQIWANEIFLVLEVFGAYLPIGGLAVKPAVDVLDSEDTVQFLETDARRYAIRSFAGPLDEPMRKFLESGVLAQVLQRVGTAENESLTIYSNQIKVRLLTPGFERALNTIDTILDLIPESDLVEKRGYSDLPPEFSPLLPLLKVWDVSDDEERWSKVKRSSKVTRKKLIATVRPFMAGISAYLDSFDDRQLSDSASALDSLAQAAMEAERSLTSGG